MERKPRLTLRDARRLHSAANNNTSAANSSSSNPNARAYRIARQSGHLNLSTRNLLTFPTEVLRLHELADEDERSWECAVLQKIDLSYNEIPALPATVNELAHVSSFKIRHNQLQQLPDAFWDLTKLTSLDLSNNLLNGALSDGIGHLANLRELLLNNNKLTALPATIELLTNLEVLNIEHNELHALPANIGALRRLHTLTAHTNQLTAIPASFAALTSLTTLDLHKNALVTVHDALVCLSALRFLDLHQNKLTSFPQLPSPSALDTLLLGFNALTTITDASLLRVKDSLSVFDMRDNRLMKLPDAVAQLARLKTLDCTNNDLSELPPGVGYLKDLHHILVDGNPLRSIRRAVVAGGSDVLKKYLRTRGPPPPGVSDALEEEVDEFALRAAANQTQTPNQIEQHAHLFRDAASFGSLQLTGMGLVAWPQQLVGAGTYNFCATLTQLTLSKNKFGHLPASIGELAALQTLVAEECALTAVDASIAQLSQLRYLRLRKNLLQSHAVDAMLAAANGPASICGSLKELDLGNNVLTTLPQHIVRLATLDTLVLSFNRMTTIDGFAWRNMQRLSILGLADNQLESLGTVYDAPLLTSLSIENNNLRQIPLELGRCEHLRALLVAGNPQRSIRVHTIQEGTEAVLKYLRNRVPLALRIAPSNRSTAELDDEEEEEEEEDDEDTENVPPTLLTTSTTNRSHLTGRLRDATSPMEKKRVRTIAPSASAAALSTPTPAAAATRQSMPPPAPTAATSSSTTTNIDSAAIDALNDKINALERSLENFALTAAKRFALKKELAMVRSQKIRLVRAATTATAATAQH